MTAVETTRPIVVVPKRMKNENRKLSWITSTIATEVNVATSKPAWRLSLKHTRIVATAASVYVIGEFPNKVIKNTAKAEPIAEAGKRTSPFLIESLTVGSIVTIAVMTAKTGGQLNQRQIVAVKNIAMPVFTIRLPAN